MNRQSLVTLQLKNNIKNEATEEHINNMQYLGVKVFDPLFEHFEGKIQINSVYRSLALNTAINGSETSQHMKGQAMDLDALPPYDNKDLFKFVVDNLDFDQIVWEFGTNECPKWVHISYKPLGNRKKKTQATSNGYIPFNLNI